MKATKALYISKSKTSHDDRFVEVFKSFLNLTEIYLDIEHQLVNGSNWINHDLIIASPLSTGITAIPENCDTQLIGICMAYEINEEAKDELALNEIYKNIQRCTAIICDSNHVKQILQNKYDFQGPLLQIAYGCTQGNFLKVKLEDVNILRVISLRNWTKIHSNETSLQALSIVGSKGLQIEAKFYGEGPELNEDIKNKMSNDSQGKISFLGAFTNDALPAILGNSEVYLSSSISDGSSVSLLEAMSAGRICICRDFPSNREWIENEVNGFLFKSAEELSEILIKISKLTYVEKLAISEMARNSVTGRGDWEVIKKSLVHFTKSLIKS
ncbi:RfaG Glycosyltransferase [Candidatus Nanopelagicaceae bacterium]